MTSTRELELKIEHLKEILNEREKQLLQYNKLTDQAIDKAVSTMNERLAGMNEFRGQQKDMIATLATKETVDRLALEITLLKEANSKAAGRAAVLQAVWGVVVVVVACLLTWFLRTV